MGSSAYNLKRRSEEEKGGRKKRKMEPPTFSDPTALVTFIIGKDDNKKTFIIHKDVVCESSSVLKAAFESEFVEGQTQTYKLEDTTERAFKLLMQWMYAGRFTVKQFQEDWAEDDEAETSENWSIIELWVLADKLCMLSLQNKAIETLDRISNVSVTIFTSEIRYIYESTSSGSPLRRYIIAQIALFLSKGQFEWASTQGFLTKEVLLDVIIFSKENLVKNGLEYSQDHFEVSDYFVEIENDILFFEQVMKIGLGKHY
ncbi:hypothetical protein EG329_011496 [Mollisiaceae sp. DMI_Dod_QoI]|nr:hypothetical protein EG329_011496 [Helotiales sp. DMI_Dod_QoI]